MSLLSTTRDRRRSQKNLRECAKVVRSYLTQIVHSMISLMRDSINRDQTKVCLSVLQATWCPSMAQRTSKATQSIITISTTWVRSTSAHHSRNSWSSGIQALDFFTNALLCVQPAQLDCQLSRLPNQALLSTLVRKKETLFYTGMVRHYREMLALIASARLPILQAVSVSIDSRSSTRQRAYVTTRMASSACGAEIWPIS